MPRILSPVDLDQFRARLCQAAERLFAERGPEAVTMRQLAAELGCSPMTPYRYFKDKDEILAAVRAQAFNRFAGRMEAAFAGPGSPLERSSAVGDAYIAFALEEPNAYRLMFDLTQPNEDTYPELKAAADRARFTMTDHVRALIEAGLIEGEPVLIGHLFWSAMHGAMVLSLAGKLDPSIDLRTLADETAATLFRGLARPGVQGA